jgi:hypothetical protein
LLLIVFLQLWPDVIAEFIIQRIHGVGPAAKTPWSLQSSGPAGAGYLFAQPFQIDASHTGSILLALHREPHEWLCVAARAQKHQLCPSDNKIS